MRRLPTLHAPLESQVSVPGSKSHTNRALLISALADGETTLQNALFSDDSNYFAQALVDLGFNVQLDPQLRMMKVRGLSGKIPTQVADLFIGNAGTAARFLTAMLTLGSGKYHLDGVKRMRQRPIGGLVAALQGLGGQVKGLGSKESKNQDNFENPTLSPRSPPLAIRANGLLGGNTSIRGDVSSQFLSAVLMVAPYAHNPVEISVAGPLHSKPYIDLTLGVMADFGVEVQRTEYKRFTIQPQKYQSPGDYVIESDASAASYFFAAPVICGGWVVIDNISQKSRQGDIRFLEILEKMGCEVTEKENAIKVTSPSNLGGIEIDMSDISDTFMTLAAIAPFADSPTTIRGITSSRLKETDRIAATATELRRLGVTVDEFADGLTIHPCKNFHPAKIQTYDDHRIAMSFALIGLRVPGIEILNPECVAKTFPNYFEVLGELK
jgi:3-phosphoshikimate 1-carboxyvinyltransferase